jgi:hypothetical protein
MFPSLDELTQNFRYVPDRKDKWTLLGGNQWEGDCEDFALTALWLVAGKSWLRLWYLVITFQAMLWLAWTPAGLHMMLWVRGKGWIDNWYPTWSSKTRHKRIAPYLAPMLAFVLLIK